jgi:acetyl esterase/lipase
MRRLLCLALLASFSAHAQSEAPIPLWPNGAPGALGKEDKDIPTITPFLPSDASIGPRPAMVIFPGGGYSALAPHEGKGYADWLVTNGVACFVVKYRLGSQGYRHPRMLEDAARAVRLVRANAHDWNVDPRRVGVIGSSAGGHLASTLLTHFDLGKSEADDSVDRQSCRPDLGILCYPLITTMGPNVHQGSKDNLLGRNPSPELVRLLSNELQVTSNTPPCFIWHTWEDTGVKVENSLEFAAALRRAKVPFDLHVYERGAHGLGLGDNHPWANDCVFWLRNRGFLKQP